MFAKKKEIIILFIVALFSNIVFSQYEITGNQVPLFHGQEQLKNHDKALNQLNHKIQDFIALNIDTEFVSKFFKSQDSIEFNFEILINKLGFADTSKIKVNTEVLFFNKEIKRVLTTLPKFKSAKTVLTNEHLDFFLTYTPEYYIDENLRFKSIYRESIRLGIIIMSGETPLIETAEKLGYIIPNQNINNKVLFHLSNTGEIRNLRFHSPHINFEIMMRKIFNNIDVKKNKTLKLLEFNKDYSIPVHIFFDKNLDELSYIESKPKQINNLYKNESKTEIEFDKAPAITGCDDKKSILETNKCNSQKINLFVKDNFDQNILNRIGLNGPQKIQIFFTIDEYGKITNIKTRAPHLKLEKEAKRIILLLPKFSPAMMKEKPVNATFYLPITINLENNTEKISPLFDSRNPYIRN